MSADAPILYEKRECVGLIRLNRPTALNALTPDMIAEIRRAVDDAEQDPSVLCIAFTGEGRAFSAGLDLAALVHDVEHGTVFGGDWRDARPPDDEADRTLTLFSHLLRMQKPVIAAVNGVAAGGGMVLAMMSDLRFAAQEAQFTAVFSKRGLVAEHMLSWLLPRQVGTSRALDLLWSSRKIDAQEALRIGLVDRVVPRERLLDDVIAYAKDLQANVSPRSLAVMKAQVYADWEASFAAASRACDRLMRDSIAHPDAKEGAQSFLERRPPRFKSWPEGK